VTGTDLPKWQESFVEQVGLMADVGFPRSAARVLAWLVVCEPRHQSAEQLRATLKLSAGAVSAAVRILVLGESVTRITFPGDRRIYYQLHPDGWQRLLRTRLQLLTQVRHVAEDALAAAGDQADERLSAMRDFYARCEAQFVQLLDELADSTQRVRGQSR
jgi:DNA-binding transcriptional regulator GbsR (MarR family)